MVVRIESLNHHEDRIRRETVLDGIRGSKIRIIILEQRFEYSNWFIKPCFIVEFNVQYLT